MTGTQMCNGVCHDCKKKKKKTSIKNVGMHVEKKFIPRNTGRGQVLMLHHWFAVKINTGTKLSNVKSA